MNFENACRLCLQFGELMCPLYECLIDESHPVRVVDFLKEYTKLSIYHADGEPDHLCYNCLVEVQRIYTFIQKCEKTEVVLKQLQDAHGQLKRLKDIEVYPEDSDSSEDIIEIEEENLTEWSGYAIPIEKHDTIQDSSRESEQIIVTPDVICLEDDAKSLLGFPIVKAKQDAQIGLDSIEDTSDQWNIAQPRRQKRRRTRNADKTQSKTCNICSRIFKHKKNLKRHILTVHSTVDLSIQCDICLRTYRNKDSLRSHTLTAHPDDVSCTRKGSIKLRCPICSKHFEHMQSYKVHFQSHKEFICQFCSKAFRRSSDLIDHLEAGERGDFRCGLCLQEFERSSCLSIHEEHHKEEQELQCKSCFKIFTNKAALQIHMQVAHDVNPLRCTVCSKQFRNKYSLGYHVRAIHPWTKGQKQAKV